jgi:hypothetical protein
LVAVEIHLGVAFNDTVEEEAVDTLGLGVGGVTRVEVGGVGFDDEDEVIWVVWGGRTGGEEEWQGKERESFALTALLAWKKRVERRI